MNLRVIKKDIEYVLSSFIEDCSSVAAANPRIDDEKYSALMDEAIDLFNELKDKVNAKNVTKKGEYFANIRKELIEKSEALYDKLSNLVKESLEASKKPAKKATAKKAAAKEAAAKEAPAQDAEPKA